MLNTNMFFHQLHDFGLNSYESKLWVALLSRGSATAGELADLAEVPRSRSYDVLESLEKKGFIMMKVGKPIRYMAVSPTHALDRVRQNILEAAKEQEHFLEKISQSNLFDELTTLHQRGVDTITPLELAGSLKGRKNIYAHMDRLIKDAARSVMIGTTPSGFSRKQDFFLNTIKKTERRGIHITFLINGTTPPTINPQLKDSINVKNAPGVSRFCLVDGEKLLFMMSDDADIAPAQEHAVWVHSPFFSSAFESLLLQRISERA